MLYDTNSIRNAMLQAIIDRAGNGAFLRLYDGTQPARGGAVTTLLAQCVCGTPFAPAPVGGVLTANAISAGVASATGTCTWFRIVQSDGSTFVLDGTASELGLSSTSVAAGKNVTISSFVITEGN